MLTSGPIELLECYLHRAPIGIPRAAVAELIEYELAPLPLAPAYVGGLGVRAEES